jgi:methyl-accepting chemotaxis protein
MSNQDQMTSEASASVEQELEQYRAWVRQIRDVMRSAVAGDLEKRLLHINCDGELREALEAVNGYLDVSDAFVREAGAALEAAASARFHRTVIEKGLRGSFRNAARIINSAGQSMKKQNDALLAAREQQLALADAFERDVQGVVGSVAAAATELLATASDMRQVADQVTSEAGRASTSADQAAASMESIAAATAQLSDSIREISNQVSHSTEAARSAVGQAGEAREKSRTLADASTRIVDVIDVIRRVAQTTGLLSINATIEAARAGEVGRGFAVVASEVKALAAQTGQATGEIEVQVNDINSSTQLVVTSIEEIVGAIGSVDKTTEAIAAAVEEQDAVTKDVSRSTAAASEEARTLLEGIGAVSASAERTTESATSLVGAAEELSEMSERLRGVVGDFLTTLRA